MHIIYYQYYMDKSIEVECIHYMSVSVIFWLEINDPKISKECHQRVILDIVLCDWDATPLHEHNFVMAKTFVIWSFFEDNTLNSPRNC